MCSWPAVRTKGTVVTGIVVTQLEGFGKYFAEWTITVRFPSAENQRDGNRISDEMFSERFIDKCSIIIRTQPVFIGSKLTKTLKQGVKYVQS